MSKQVPPVQRTAIDRRLVLERAEAFLRAHPADSVTMAQLCEVTGVSERTLRNAFYDLRGMSPKQYILRTRLERVHRALVHRERQTTITSIATDYGFYELGRFASRYRSIFGERPSDTLRASAPATLAN